MRNTILTERGVAITYKQRGIVIEDVPAVPSKSRALNDKNGEYWSKHIDRHYTIELSLLTWEGQQIRPKPGDHIIESDTVYEVIPDEVKQCYRPIDPNETYVRIFVQKIK